MIYNDVSIHIATKWMTSCGCLLSNYLTYKPSICYIFDPKWYLIYPRCISANYKWNVPTFLCNHGNIMTVNLTARNFCAKI